MSRSAARAAGRPESPIRLSACVVAAVSVLAACFFAASAHAATASWSLTPPSYDFGARLPGTGPSNPAAFILTNTGEAQLPSPSVFMTSSSGAGFEPLPFGFGFTASDCESRTSLAPAESCAADVTFNPLYPGQSQGSITFTDPSSQVAPVSAAFSGRGIGPIVSFSPPRNLTAAVNEGPSQPQVLTVANDGDADLSISGISLIGDNASHFAIVGGKCQPGGTVAPGASCTIQVTYSPTTAGFLLGELKLTDNAAHGFQTTGLQGVGSAPVATKTWPLAVFISQRPHRASTRRFATFRFGVPDVHVQFVCKLDHRPYRPCTSPTTYRKLAFGDHAFKVKVLSPPPGVYPAPAVARFQVMPKRAG